MDHFDSSAVKRPAVLLLALLFTIITGGCAQTGSNDDPLEPVNRTVLEFNDTVDKYALKPAARGYAYVVPEYIRVGLRNFFDNLTYPSVIINQFLQGKWERGLADAGRFLFNSTVGFAGLADMATELGLEAHDEDFGQTFAVWGFGQGPYLVLPLFGPSTLRDGVGLGVGYFTYLPGYLEEESAFWAVFATHTIVERERRLDQEKLIRGDRYLFLRDAYLQQRRYLIEDGRPAEDPFLGN